MKSKSKSTYIYFLLHYSGTNQSIQTLDGKIGKEDNNRLREIIDEHDTFPNASSTINGVCHNLNRSLTSEQECTPPSYYTEYMDLVSGMIFDLGLLDDHTIFIRD